MFYHRVLRTFITAPFFVVIIVAHDDSMITMCCARKTFLLLLLLQQQATEIQRAKACLTTEERRTHFENFFLQILGLETLKLFFLSFGAKTQTHARHIFNIS
jgi:hypothetical protein